MSEWLSQIPTLMIRLGNFGLNIGDTLNVGTSGNRIRLFYRIAEEPISR